MGKEKKAVLVYHDFYEHLKDLSFEDKGKIFDAILEYDMTGSVSIELNPVLNMAFKFIKAAIDRDKEAYSKKCVKNSQNGSKGGRPNSAHEPNGSENNPKNRTVFDETEENTNEENKPPREPVRGENEEFSTKHDEAKKPNGYLENPKNRTVNSESEKTERLIQKAKKADNDTDNENDIDNENDPLPIEGVIGGDNNQAETLKVSGRREGGLFPSFLKRVKDKIPDEHVENCFLSLAELVKSENGLLKCTDDWIFTVFNKNEKTNFPAKSLVEYARANLQKYSLPSKRTPDSVQTQEYLEKNRETAKNSVNPLEFAKDEALHWLKNLPAFWRGKSKIASNLIKKYGFSESDYNSGLNAENK